MEGGEGVKSIKLHLNNTNITTKAGKVRVEISLFLPIIIIVTAMMKSLEGFMIAYAVIALHELSHLLFAKILGVAITAVKLLPIGFTAIMPMGSVAVKKRVMIYAAGPGANLLLCLIFAGLLQVSSDEKLYYFLQVNMSLAAMNLMPIIPLDGGRIFAELLGSKLGWHKGLKLIRALSLMLSLLLVGAGIIQLQRSGYNFSGLAMGLYIISLLRLNKMEAALMNVENIIYRRSRLLKKGVYPARDLVVVENKLVSDTLKGMDFDRYHFIYVLDEKLKLIRIFTEQEVMDALIEKGTHITYHDLIRIHDMK